jgi:transposase InsO family protein
MILKRFLAHFPHRVHTILTDNGSEFTDRFAVEMKDKPHDRPSGRHPFDRICARHNIDHHLTKPFRPQTNGLVERFNRRIVEAIGRQPKRGIAHRLFASHVEQDAFLNRFSTTTIEPASSVSAAWRRSGHHGRAFHYRAAIGVEGAPQLG